MTKLANYPKYLFTPDMSKLDKRADWQCQLVKMSCRTRSGGFPTKPKCTSIQIFLSKINSTNAHTSIYIDISIYLCIHNLLTL